MPITSEPVDTPVATQDILKHAASERFQRVLRVSAFAMNSPLAHILLIDGRRSSFELPMPNGPMSTERLLDLSRRVLKTGEVLKMDTILIVPIERPRSRIFGALAFEHHEPREWNAGDIALARDLSVLALAELERQALITVLRTLKTPSDRPRKISLAPAAAG